MPQAGASALWRRTEAIQAAKENHTDDLKRLLDAGGTDIEDACNDERQTLLHVAALHGADECLFWLLRRPRLRKKVDSRDLASRTALHLAAAMGYDGCVQRLVEVAAALDRQDETRSTPLLLAVRFDWTNSARILLEAGADPLIEDQQGCNAVDVAKQGSEAAELMSAFAGMRRPSGWLQLRRCLVPQIWRSKGARQEVYLAGGEATPVPGHLVLGSPHGDSPQFSGAQEKPSLKLERRQGPPSSGYVQTDGQHDVCNHHLKEHTASGASAVVAPEALPRVLQTKSQELGSTASRTDAVSGAQAPSIQVQDDFAIFRLHAFFDEDVKRLEFEVAWKDQQPAVGTVKPGGEAECRGMVPGDRLIEIGGILTTGKGRDQLLPLLKGRPLLLKVDREDRVRDAQDPHIQLEVKLGASGDNIGLQITRLGQMPAVSAVVLHSAAWAAGLLEGDALVRVNGADVESASNDDVLAALEARPGLLTIWRRPAGSDLRKPWIPKATKNTGTVSRLL